MTKEEKESQYQKEYYEKNKQKKKEYRNKNKENQKEYQKKYRAENKEKHKEYNTIYYEINKEKYKEFFKTYYENNKEKKKEYLKKYRETNKDKISTAHYTYKKNRKAIDPLFKLVLNIRSVLSYTIKKKGYTKKSKSEEILGCSIADFKQYLESLWEPWMTWENYGKYEKNSFNIGWDIDHKIPVSSAKTENEIIELNHYSNLQPLCSKINRDVKKAN